MATVTYGTVAANPVASMGALPTGGLITIASNSQANPTVVTTVLPHGLSTGDKVYFASTNSTPVIDGLRTVTVISPTTFSVPVNVTVAGTAGTYKPVMTAASIANPTVVTSGSTHGLRTGDVVTFAGTDSTPALDGDQTVTVIDATTFSVAVNVTVAGTAGQYLKKTYYSDVVDRGGAAGGGALVISSTAGTAPVTVTANIEGSVDGTNFFNVPYSLVATPRTFVVTALTISSGVTTTYLLQELIFWRYLRLKCASATNIALSLTHYQAN